MTTIHQDIPYLLNKNAKKPVTSTLPGNGGVQIAAENRIDITTQNPPMATSCGFESHHRHQLVTSVISLATSFL